MAEVEKVGCCSGSADVSKRGPADQVLTEFWEHVAGCEELGPRVCCALRQLVEDEVGLTAEAVLGCLKAEDEHVEE